MNFNLGLLTLKTVLFITASKVWVVAELNVLGLLGQSVGELTGMLGA